VRMDQMGAGALSRPARRRPELQARLPLLSTWLGHVDPKSTYWYLQAVPELLALAAGRLEPSGQEGQAAP
jgi:integrase/recombinase XerD